MEKTLQETSLADTFAETSAPKTDRRVLQLTEGPGFCYPLYYYIPSVTKDGRYLVHHRAHDGHVQLHRLNLATGESEQLTDASANDAQWHHWCTDPGTGVLDHRSVLNTVRREVVYFDGIDVRAVDIDTISNRRLFTLDADRRAIGQNCVTPDGEWLLFIHHDREMFKRMIEGNRVDRHRSQGTILEAYHFDTGEHRELVRINSPIHHVLPYDNEHVIFCHPATENGMLLTDLEGGWYMHLRTQDEYGGSVCHYLATDAGITYEVLGGSRGVLGGVYDPFTHDCVEFELPKGFGYTHTGFDPEGRLFFYENERKDAHDIRYLSHRNPNGVDEWKCVIGHWPTYGGGQKAHFHPRLTPDRNWILFTAGDSATKTNQIYLLNVMSLSSTRGLQGVFD